MWRNTKSQGRWIWTQMTTIPSRLQNLRGWFHLETPRLGPRPAPSQRGGPLSFPGNDLTPTRLPLLPTHVPLVWLYPCQRPSHLPGASPTPDNLAPLLTALRPPLEERNELTPLSPTWPPHCHCRQGVCSGGGGSGEGPPSNPAVGPGTSLSLSEPPSPL